MPLPELPVLGSLRTGAEVLRESPWRPQPRYLQFTVPHIEFGRASDAVLEFSYNDVHRQEAVTKLVESSFTRPLLLPIQGTRKGRCLGRLSGRQGIDVSLLRVCESTSFVLHPGCLVYQWKSPSATILFQLSGRETRTQDAVQWHIRYIQSLLEASVMERPKNPFSFMADLVGTCCAVKDTGLDQGVRSLHLLWAEGLPRDALLSVRCGQKSRQASLEDLLNGRKRLEIGEGSVVQVQVLVRESMIGLPPPFVEEQLHSVQFPRASVSSPSRCCHGALLRSEDLLQLQIRVQYAHSTTPRPSYTACESEAGKQYLIDHGLNDFAQSLIRELVQVRPGDVLSFIKGKLSAKQ